MKAASGKRTLRPDGTALWQLRERIKELTALHHAAKVLQQRGSTDRMISQMLRLLPPAWQYPGIAAARICYDGRCYATANFRQTRWTQRAEFRVSPDKQGSIEVCYLKPRPPMDEGPFLKEERALIDSLAQILRSYFLRQLYEQQLLSANKRLGLQVSRRTADLLKANEHLKQEISQRRGKDRKIQHYQQQLRALASDLSLAEEKERRVIATGLHDRIGQALAVIKLKFLELHCNRMRCQFQENIDEIRVLLDQAIGDTRNLTFEISPPILYELGLVPALQWLAENFQQHHHLLVNLSVWGNQPPLSDDIKVTLFKATREFLMNAAKHAKPQQIWINAMFDRHQAKVVVRDDGRGLADAGTTPVASYHGGFGLFSLRERAGYFGGSVDLSPADGGGATATIVLPVTPAGQGAKR
ncbi:MAG TPA: ATP-binding protein [Candidatus Edwardsbacteria bacterium]|nr:ATP-binding protein [Candidatus Edwardsbacteria bacterium]